MTLRLASAAPAAPDPRLAEASRALESMLIKQIITSSGAFKGGESAGKDVRADLFASTLADAVAGSGGLGIADQLTRSLTPGQAPVPGARPAQVGPSPSAHQPSGENAAAGLSALGLAGGRLSSGFGVRNDPFTGERETHTGMDVGAPEGTPIRSPAGGVVLSAGPRGGYGNAVEIDHGNGLVTLYGHASELLVSKGDSVVPGQEIATVGSSGRSTGPHLHFEVRRSGHPVDPSRALKKYGLRAEGSDGSGP